MAVPEAAPCALEAGNRGKVQVKVCFQDQGHVLEKRVDLGRGGWHTFSIVEAIQSLFGWGEMCLDLDERCGTCQGAGGAGGTGCQGTQATG